MSERREMIERRKHARVALCCECSLTISGQRYVGTTDNVSLGGVYLGMIDPPLPKESVLQTGELLLTLDQDQFTAQCEVVFIGGDPSFPTGVGIAFQDLSQQNSDKLKAFILQRV